MSRGMDNMAAVLRTGSTDSTIMVSVRKGPFSPLRWSMPSSRIEMRAGSVHIGTTVGAALLEACAWGVAAWDVVTADTWLGTAAVVRSSAAVGALLPACGGGGSSTGESATSCRTLT